MSNYKPQYSSIEAFIKNERKPDFNQLLKVLRREKPDRPTLFEFFLNEELYKDLTKNIEYDKEDPNFYYKRLLDSFRIAGYDYATILASDFHFYSNRHYEKASISLNQGTIIFDRESFDNYKWPDPADYDYSRVEVLKNYMPDGMKLIIHSPGGVLENTIDLVGYENLCYMLIDEPDLAKEIFDKIGSILLKYYEICSKLEGVGALISNDDWGFNSQTMLSVDDMRKYVIPWHKKIVETIHKAGKPAILHSCGKVELVMDDIIDDIKFQAKHSYEDKIMPVETAYEKYSDRIAILGGIDVDFLCRSTPEEVFDRASRLLELTGTKGYALGSGNSIPYYVPEKNYLAMIAAAVLA